MFESCRGRRKSAGLASDRVQHVLGYTFFEDEGAECPLYMTFYGEPIVAILELGNTGSPRS